MYLAGWSFGILESICVTILVGLIVDYVVHMGMSYLESPSPDRRSRTVYAAVHMGVSICSGAISTVGASVFLCACTITFFPKFGIFMAVTIAGSFVCAGVIFPAALMELGPQRSGGEFLRRSKTSPKELEMTTSPLMLLSQFSSTGAKGGSGDADNDAGLSSSPSLGAPSLASRILEYWHVIFAGLLLLCAGIAYSSCPPGQTFCSPVVAEFKELTLEFKMPHFGVTSAQTTYECHGFDFPQDETYHITSFDPIEADATRGVLHHMILYKSFVPASKCFRECIDMPSDSQLVWAWAVGMASFPMPPDVGYPVPSPRNKYMYCTVLD